VQGRGRASCSAPRARPDWGHADAARPGGHEACIASRRGRPEGGVPAVRNARRSVRPQRVGDHPPTAPRWARSEARDGAGDWPPRGSRAAARVSALPSWLRTSPRPPPPGDHRRHHHHPRGRGGREARSRCGLSASTRTCASQS